MNPAISAAIIAATVSLIVATISFVTNRRSIKSEREKLEREMQRRLTEKLYDMRLEAYPKAFEITELLRGDLIFDKAMTQKEFLDIRNKLFEWQRTKAAFVMSENALKAFRNLQNKLNNKPQSGASFKESEVEEIWEAKNYFRRSLRRDINLIYSEEAIKDNRREDKNHRNHTAA
jgi:hypothetical protein